jgi:hypothetical protein
MNLKSQTLDPGIKVLPGAFVLRIFTSVAFNFSYTYFLLEAE